MTDKLSLLFWITWTSLGSRVVCLHLFISKKNYYIALFAIFYGLSAVRKDGVGCRQQQTLSMIRHFILVLKYNTLVNVPERVKERRCTWVAIFKTKSSWRSLKKFKSGCLFSTTDYKDSVKVNIAIIIIWTIREEMCNMLVDLFSYADVCRAREVEELLANIITCCYLSITMATFHVLSII